MIVNYFQSVKQISVFEKIGMNVVFSNQQLAWAVNRFILMRQLHLEPADLQGTPPFRCPRGLTLPGGLTGAQIADYTALI
jgi:hypothetical protein